MKMMDEITSAVLNIDGDHIDGKVPAENDINNLYVFQAVMKALYFDAEICQRKVRGRANFFARSVSLVTNIGGSFS
ncbi:hypothetical protein EAO30_14490 [Klebsiella pneumoniae]|nr:hypothetical protein EAO30_14490 [Klebsiella pneumoniae]